MRVMNSELQIEAKERIDIDKLEEEFSITDLGKPG